MSNIFCDLRFLKMPRCCVDRKPAAPSRMASDLDKMHGQKLGRRDLKMDLKMVFYHCLEMFFTILVGGIWRGWIG